MSAASHAEGSSSLPPTQPLTLVSLRWRLRPDSLRPSLKRATFQTPPIVAEERGGSAGGTNCPPANQITQLVSLTWRLRPDSLRPSLKRATFQTPPIVAEERGGSAGGQLSPPRIKSRN